MDKKLKEVSQLLFPEEQETKSSSQKFDEILRKKLKTLRFNEHSKIEQETQIGENIQELANFIQNHVITVGKEQAVLDFQVGLNLLNGYKKDSFIDAKIQLEEDSDFGEKTFSALLDVLKNYPVDVVNKFIKLGAINNEIWNTKNNNQIDTNKTVEILTQKLDEGEV
ncbi:hypothetical protein IJ425_02410 [bacterium]|nr:hypothetical protein [bacterium]